METIAPIPGASNVSGVSSGAIVADDGTPPMRAVIRCVANAHMQLWHKGSGQQQFRPDDLHITHVFIYAIKAELVHASH